MTDNVLRRARIAVLESLYESESSNHDPEDVYERQMERAEQEDPELAAEGPRGFGKGMLRGIWKNRQELDRHIGEAAPKYPVSAMAVPSWRSSSYVQCSQRSCRSRPVTDSLAMAAIGL